MRHDYGVRLGCRRKVARRGHHVKQEHQQPDVQHHEVSDRRQLRATAAGPEAPVAITLRGGAEYALRSTVQLTAADSGLTIRSFPGERAELSGASPLTRQPLKWEPYNVTNGTVATMTLAPSTNLVFGAAFGLRRSAVDARTDRHLPLRYFA